ncbi:hypothetical protein [Rhodococcus erythropolis]|uniref:Plasmid replication, integration and excision activator n=2 Tax=Rhodococcus erythropolis TaxID=1833 RepID=A0A2Z5TT87_RHOER|nr:hypothetical protein [Rhodococcus erythropolis]BBA94283.1 hypothetical protein [Rhodococcus erythropolis]
MALKAAGNVIPDSSAYEYRAVQVEPKMVRKDPEDPNSEQFQKQKDGTPVWSIDCIRVDRASGNKAIVTVTVPDVMEPDVAGPVEFSEMIAGFWVSRSGSGMWFSASAVASL